MATQQVIPEWDGTPHDSTSSFEYVPSWLPTLQWNAPGTRYFETGVDRGVLYTEAGAVVWNGLIAVSEEPQNAEVRTVYIDGQKVVNVVILDEYAATLEAFTYPDEFEPCIGTQPYAPRSGLLVTHQPRTTFNLCYRTRFGNDVDRSDYDYKLHLVYNATVMPEGRDYQTISDETEPTTFSWDITATPIDIEGFKNTAHITLDMRRVPRVLREEIEQVLYGADGSPGRMPSPVELTTWFESTFLLSITDHGDGTWTATSLDSIVDFTSETSFQIDYPTAVFLDDISYEVSSG